MNKKVISVFSLSFALFSLFSLSSCSKKKIDNNFNTLIECIKRDSDYKYGLESDKRYTAVINTNKIGEDEYRVSLYTGDKYGGIALYCESWKSYSDFYYVNRIDFGKTAIQNENFYCRFSLETDLINFALSSLPENEIGYNMYEISSNFNNDSIYFPEDMTMLLPYETNKTRGEFEDKAKELVKYSLDKFASYLTFCDLDIKDFGFKNL